MYNIFTLLIVSIVINKYTLQKDNAKLYLLLQNYLFPIIFFARPKLDGYYPKEKYNIITSKKIDDYLNYSPYTLNKRGRNKFKFYLFFYKVFKKFFLNNTSNYFIIFLRFVNYNIFTNKFIYNPRQRN